MRRYLPYLRIVWTALCVTACVLLVVLWVRSYSRGDSFTYRQGNTWTGVGSVAGGLTASRTSDPYLPFGMGWFLESFGPDEFGDPSASRFIWDNSPTSRCIGVPHWFAVVIFAVLTILPLRRYFSWRFTLRSLLIATTLVAVVLGLVVYFVR